MKGSDGGAKILQAPTTGPIPQGSPLRGSEKILFKRRCRSLPTAKARGHYSAIWTGESMKKAEAEKAIRYLCTEWAKEQGIPYASPYPKQASFSAFRSWLEAKGYSHYLNFRSVIGPLEDAERWFDQEFKQTWAN